MKQITIYDLLPLLKKGWVCYNGFGDWLWFRWKPKKEGPYWMSGGRHCECPVFLSYAFNIAKVEDWRKSLRKVEKEQKRIKIQNAVIKSSEIILNEMKKERQKTALDSFNEYKKTIKGAEQ